MTGKAGAPLTEAMFYVLMALRRGELCGTEIAAWTERCTEGRVRLGPGTLYTILGRFLEEDFIQETSVQGRQRNAPTERGVRHLHELMRAVEEGHRATAFFVIQMADVLDFAPNDTTHPAFGEALREAARRGVEIVAYTCRVTPETVTLDAPVPVRL